MFVPRDICNTLNEDVSGYINMIGPRSLVSISRHGPPPQLSNALSSFPSPSHALSLSLHRFLTFFPLLLRSLLSSVRSLRAAADSGFLRQISESSIPACELNLSG